MAGTITLSESINETHIKWKISRFFNREDNLIISPDFILFKSKWFLQLHLGGTLTFSDTENESCEPLRMSLLSLNPTTEYHIEYRMGIYACNGSEITTEKFESMLNKGFCQTPQRRALISRKDFESSRNILVTENTVTVFCTVCLISAVYPAGGVSSPILSTDRDLFSSSLLFCDEIKSTGEITLDESNNETRIEWNIKDFFNRKNCFLYSPHCLFFNSKWFLQISNLQIFIESFSVPDTVSDSSLTMNLNKYSTAELHIEYRMGIQMSNGTEIKNERFESISDKNEWSLKKCKIISRKDLESASDILDSENTLKVFCTVRLLSDDNSPGNITLLDNFLFPHCDYWHRKVVGEIILDQLENYTRIEWTINHLFLRSHVLMKSPDFILFESNWCLQIVNKHSYLPVTGSFYSSKKSLFISLQRDCHSTAECHIECRMGIKRSDGSEITTPKFESVYQPRFEKTPRELITETHLKRIEHTLTTLKVFCTVRLLNDDNTAEVVQPAISSAYGSGASYENPKNASVTKDIFNLDIKAKDVHLAKANSTLNTNNEASSPTKGIFKFGETFKDTGASYKNPKSTSLTKDSFTLKENAVDAPLTKGMFNFCETSISKGTAASYENLKSDNLAKGIFTFNAKDMHLTKDNSTSNTNNEVSWPTKGIFKFGVQISQENSKSISSTGGIRTLNDSDKDGLISKGNSTITENSKPSALGEFLVNFKGARTLQENSKSVSSTKGISTLNESNKIGLVCKGNSTITEHSKHSTISECLASFKGFGTSYEISKLVRRTEDSNTLSENVQDLRLSKDISTQTDPSETSWLPKGIFNFNENFKGPVTSFNSVPSKDVCLSKEHHILSEKFERLFQSKRFADVTIKVQSKEFLAHKLILSSSSEVFASMFEHDTSEKRSHVIDITDCDPHSFENFLLYLYTGKLNTVSSSNAASLFKTADKYGVSELRRECVRCMSQDMTVDSFCDVFHLAVLHGESDLLTNAINFFIRNASAILITKEWLTLLEEHTSLCNELLVKFAKSNSELSSRHNRLRTGTSISQRVSGK